MENIPDPDPIIQSINMFINMDLPGARAISQDLFSSICLLLD
jgi:hypothetical protein